MPEERRTVEPLPEELLFVPEERLTVEPPLVLLPEERRTVEPLPEERLVCVVVEFSVVVPPLLRTCATETDANIAAIDIVAITL